MVASTLDQLPIVHDSSSQTPCAACHSSCCRQFTVPLTVADIRQIANDRRIRFWDFVCRWSDFDNSIARGIVPHFYFDDMPGTPFVIGILHSGSEQFPGTRKCCFLTETSSPRNSCGSSACGIYESRPLICRTFPYQLDESNQVSAERSVIDHPGQERNFESLCPREWLLTEEQFTHVRNDLGELQTQMQLLHLMAERWNRNPGPWILFPEFVQFIADSTN